MVLDKMPKHVDWGRLSEYEQMDMTRFITDSFACVRWL